MEYSEFTKKALIDAARLDPDDFLAFGANYFYCGYKPLNDPEGYAYNHKIAIAFALIGKTYCSTQAGGSNYHKGIAYVAKEMGLPKRQLKVLRKKYRVENGFVYKISFNIHLIIKKMIELLSAQEEDTLIVEYLKEKESKMYREILISDQYAAIAIASEKDDTIAAVYGELRYLTKKVGD